MRQEDVAPRHHNARTARQSDADDVEHVFAEEIVPDNCVDHKIMRYRKPSPHEAWKMVICASAFERQRMTYARFSPR